jgi:hypothetical protein
MSRFLYIRSNDPLNFNSVFSMKRQCTEAVPPPSRIERVLSRLDEYGKTLYDSLFPYLLDDLILFVIDYDCQYVDDVPDSSPYIRRHFSFPLFQSVYLRFFHPNDIEEVWASRDLCTNVTRFSPSWGVAWIRLKNVKEWVLHCYYATGSSYSGDWTDFLDSSDKRRSIRNGECVYNYRGCLLPEDSCLTLETIHDRPCVSVKLFAGREDVCERYNREGQLLRRTLAVGPTGEITVNRDYTEYHDSGTRLVCRTIFKEETPRNWTFQLEDTKTNQGNLRVFVDDEWWRLEYDPRNRRPDLPVEVTFGCREDEEEYKFNSLTEVYEFAPVPFNWKKPGELSSIGRQRMRHLSEAITVRSRLTRKIEEYKLFPLALIREQIEAFSARVKGKVPLLYNM